LLEKRNTAAGGGSGIGRATSLLMAKQAAKVVIADYVP
jgi:NAD(P)-dependent dehydrogenase (short-subunit alcohol dehydrogenase family)